MTHVSLDHYNNPSFGYGGYCLPKDTKQLLANFEDVLNSIITTIVDTNETRKDHIASTVVNRRLDVVGIYQLTMKTGSNNFRHSAIQGVMERLKKDDIEIVVYEPSLEEEMFDGNQVLNNFEAFKQESDVIIANRLSD